MADEFDELEAEADALLGQNPDHAMAALVQRLRAANKRADKRGYERALAEAQRQQAQEKAFAKIPPAVRPLFNGIDPTDSKAIQAQVDALKAIGLKLEADEPEGQPQATPQQQGQAAQQAAVTTDPMLAAQQAMQAAAAGGSTPGLAGDLATRMQDMEANPGKYSDEQRDAVVREYNDAVRSAARQGTSGARG